MPPVKIFWHDGLKETPDIPGVPKGEYLEDPPTRSNPRAAGQEAPARPRPSGFVGAAFDFESFEPVRQ